MADTEAIKQATAQATVQAAKAAVLVIRRVGRRETMNAEQNGASGVTDNEPDPFYGNQYSTRM